MVRQQTISNLIAIGIDSKLAKDVVDAGYNLTLLKAESRYRLRSRFPNHIVDILVKAVQRQPIPEVTINRLIEECDWHCCVCWDIDNTKPVVIHHIEEHSKTHDDTYDNLVLLCPDHHASAHSRWENTRAPHPPEFIRQRKRQFIQALAEFKAGNRVAPGREPFRADSISVGPAPPRYFRGRVDTLQLLRIKLSSDNSRVISIVGMGGLGKTALAKKLASDCAQDFAGGVFWTSLLDSGGEATQILRGWAEMCGSTVSPVQTEDEILQIVRNLLAGRCRSYGKLLIILDDIRWEWLEVTKLLLSAIPEDASVCITLRDHTIANFLDAEPFDLDLPTLEDSIEILTAYAGLESIEREALEARALVEVTGRLPLAIELAGRLIRRMGRKPGNHIAKLREMISARAETALSYPGHPGLAATFAISYDALKSYHQRLFRWLGVFAEAPIEKTEIALIMNTSISVLELRLDELVFSSLLSFGLAEGTYTIHPMLHQYAWDLLGNSREKRAARRHHLTTYVTVCEQSLIKGANVDATMERLLPNILKAIDTAEELGDYTDICRISDAYNKSGFFDRRGYLQQGERILRAASEASARTGSKREEAVHAGNLTQLLVRQGRTADALTLAQRAERTSREIKDGYNRSAYLNHVAQIFLAQGNLAEAEKYFLDGLGIAVTYSNWSVALDQIVGLGLVCSSYGDYERAIKHYQAAIELAVQQKNRLVEANCISNLGRCLAIVGDTEQAEKYINEALVIAREIGDLNGEANRLGHLANIRAYRGDFVEALPLVEEAITVARKAENTVLETEWIGVKGLYLLESMRLDEAEDCLRLAADVAHKAGRASTEGKWLVWLGDLRRRQGDITGARALCLEAMAIINDLNSVEYDQAKQLLARLQ